MRAAVLVLNAGSSSPKFSLYAAALKLLLCRGQVASVAGAVTMHASDVAGIALVDRTLAAGSDAAEWPTVLLEWIDTVYPGITLAATAHRVVHGGPRYTAPVLIEADVLRELHRMTPLAPLHQPHALAAIATLMATHPALPQIACFDTVFHHTLPLVESSFALSRALYDEGLRRYGFHGLAYEYIAGRLPDLLGAWPAAGRIVVAHQDAGASMCALLDGCSIATTMSLTPLDGLPMATRCGAIDPSAVLYLLQENGLSADRVADLLYHDSGMPAYQTSAATCRRCWPANRQPLRKPSTCSSTGSGANSVRWPPHWVGSMHWSSPAASANTPHKSASASAKAQPGSASKSTRSQMRRMARASPLLKAPRWHGPSPPTKTT